jgi:xylulokinase
MLEAVGIDERQLPVVRPPEAVGGTLRAGAAAVFGLRAGIPVVVGGGDDIEILGNGLLGPGECLEHLGTTGSILTVSDHPALDPEMRLEVYPHAIPGMWVLGGSMTAAGAAIAAARSLLGFTPQDALAALAAATVPSAGDPVFLPDLSGQRCPVRAPQAKGGWLGLTPDSTREALVASSFRGVAYGLRRILARIEDLAGEQRVVTVSGGYDLEPAWLQLRADVYERPLALLETSEPTALGAAIVAAAGIGLYPDVAAAVGATVRRAGRIDPDPSRSGALRRGYERFVRFNQALVDAWDDTGA